MTKQSDNAMKMAYDPPFKTVRTVAAQKEKSMREQVELTFKIGFPLSTDMKSTMAFERKIVADASLICGGCETAFSSGWWAEDGASHAVRFTGEVKKETTLTLTVSCEIKKTDVAYSYIKKSIVVYANYYGIKTNWVHVKRVPFTGMHFSVEDTNLSASEIRDIMSPGTRFAHG